MNRKYLGLAALTSIGLIAVACSATGPFNDDSGDDDGSSNGSGGNSAGGNSASGNSSTSSMNTGGFNPAGTGGGETGNDCVSGDDEDKDMDGYTKTQGDCNDCDANQNPGAVEVPTDTTDPEAMPADENCDGPNRRARGGV